MAEKSWRNSVLTSLRSRNRRQVEPFQDLIALQAKTFEKTAQLQQENARLQYANEQLRRNVPMAAEGALASSTDEDVAELKRKIFGLQEELTSLHRKKGENAQQVIDLTANVKTLEAKMAEKASQIAAYEAEIANLKGAMSKLKSETQELTETNQLLKDEYTTLQLALSSAENKLLTAQKENDRLVAQVMALKERDVAQMNMENDLFLQKKQEEVRRQLLEAAKEPKVVVAAKAKG